MSPSLSVPVSEHKNPQYDLMSAWLVVAMKASGQNCSLGAFSVIMGTLKEQELRLVTNLTKLRPSFVSCDKVQRVLVKHRICDRSTDVWYERSKTCQSGAKVNEIHFCSYYRFHIFTMFLSGLEDCDSTGTLHGCSSVLQMSGVVSRSASEFGLNQPVDPHD
ncbi:uncharacterized protein V6R79_001566 [Siganus canaliculatus]